MKSEKIKLLSGHTKVGDGFRYAGHKIDEFGEAAGSKTDELIHRGQKMTHDIQKGMNEYSENVAEYIKKHPIKLSLITAGGIGLLLGLILKK